jgi:hypothetical protein
MRLDCTCCSNGIHSRAAFDCIPLQSSAPFENKEPIDMSLAIALITNRKLFVYTITPMSIASAPRSPYTIGGPAGLFVMPK